MATSALAVLYQWLVEEYQKKIHLLHSMFIYILLYWGKTWIWNNSDKRLVINNFHSHCAINWYLSYRNHLLTICQLEWCNNKTSNIWLTCDDAATSTTTFPLFFKRSGANVKLSRVVKRSTYTNTPVLKVIKFSQAEIVTFNSKTDLQVT